jgi:hypothetical protein
MTAHSCLLSLREARVTDVTGERLGINGVGYDSRGRGRQPQSSATVGEMYLVSLVSIVTSFSQYEYER